MRRCETGELQSEHDKAIHETLEGHIVGTAQSRARRPLGVFDASNLPKFR
jgi:hypothetical protein